VLIAAVCLHPVAGLALLKQQPVLAWSAMTAPEESARLLLILDMPRLLSRAIAHGHWFPTSQRVKHDQQLQVGGVKEWQARWQDAVNAPVMRVSCSRRIGGGRGGVVSVCTLPGGVALRRAEEIVPDSRNGLCTGLGVRKSAGCSDGRVNSSGVPKSMA